MKHEQSKFQFKQFMKTLKILIQFNQPIYVTMFFQTIYIICLCFMNWIFRYYFFNYVVNYTVNIRHAKQM